MWILAIAMLLCAQEQDPRTGQSEPSAVPSATARQPVGAPRGGQVLRIYDVVDLLDSLNCDVEPPELGLSQPNSGLNGGINPSLESGRESTIGQDSRLSGIDPRQLGFLDKLLGDEKQAWVRMRAGETLGAIVRQYMAPPMSGPLESVEWTRSGALVANLIPEQHLWLEAFLSTQRSFNGFIQIDAQLFMTPHGQLNKLGVGTRAILPTPEARDTFAASLQTNAKTTLVTTPTLTVLPNQRANVSILKQVAYVKDWTIEIVEPNNQEVADPQIGVVNEGLVLDLRATPTSAEEFGLDLQLTNCKLKRPIRTMKTRLSTSTNSQVEIGLPEVATVRIATTFRLADGASFVLSNPGQDDTDLVLLITARRVERLDSAPLKLAPSER